LQVPPRNDLRDFGKHSLKLHKNHGVGRQIRLDRSADQEMLLFDHRLNSSSFGQQQFFGFERVHGLFCIFRATVSASSITAMAQ